MEEKNKTEEKVLKAASGMMMLVLGILMILVSIPLIVAGCVWNFLVQSVIVSVVLLVLGIIVLCGLKILQPNEALVLTLFGKYYGTLYNAGFYWVNPFCEAVNPTAVSKISGNISKEKIKSIIDAIGGNIA